MTTRELEFTEDELWRVVDALDGTPGAWVNLQPGLLPDDLPPPRGLVSAVFTARGPDVPIATWVPAERSLGIQHASGPKARERLEIPDGWRVTQDHPKRGLVIIVPEETTHDAVLAWLVPAARQLCRLPLTGDWLATIYT